MLAPRILLHFSHTPPSPAEEQTEQAVLEEQAERHWTLLKEGPTHKMLSTNSTEGFIFIFNFQFGPFARGYQTFAFFLMGLWAGRRRLLQNPEQHRSFFRKALIWCGSLSMAPLALALVGFLIWKLTGGAIPDSGGGDEATSISALYRWPAIVGLTLYDLWNLLMTWAIIAAFALLYMKPPVQRGLEWFAPVGRMALTSYVFQSILGGLLFFSFGLTALGEIGNSVTLPVGVFLFAVQMWVCHLWLQHFRYGPLEWLWRSLTWFRVQPFRR